MKDLKNFFRNKKILITGHTGFKGSWLTQILLNWNACVAGIALRPNTTPNLFSLLKIKSRINNYFADIRNFKKISEIVKKEKPEIVFHLAAQPLVRDSYNTPLYTFETNTIGTANLLQAVKEIGRVKSVVIITTDKVYKNEKFHRPFQETDKLGGHDPYSSSKAAAEIIIDSYIKSFFSPEDYSKKHHTLIASARSGNVIGGGDWAKDRIIPDIIKAVFEKDRKVIIRNPEAIRPWQHVLEPSLGYLLLAKKLYEGKKEFSGAWNFGPHEKNYLTVKELIEKALKILERGSYIVKRDPTKPEAQLLKLDSRKAKSVLGWQPTLNLKETIELTLDWYKNFYSKKDIINLTNQQIALFFNKQI